MKEKIFYLGYEINVPFRYSSMLFVLLLLSSPFLYFLPLVLLLFLIIKRMGYLKMMRKTIDRSIFWEKHSGIDELLAEYELEFEK